MPPIKEQKQVFDITFGDSLDFDKLDLQSIRDFLQAAHDKVKV